MENNSFGSGLQEMLSELSREQEYLNMEQYFEYWTGIMHINNKIVTMFSENIFEAYKFFIHYECSKMNQNIKIRIADTTFKIDDKISSEIRHPSSDLKQAGASFIKKQYTAYETDGNFLKSKRASIVFNQSFVKTFSMISEFNDNVFSQKMIAIFQENLKFDGKLFDLCIKGLFKIEHIILKPYQSFINKLTEKANIKETLFSFDFAVLTLGERQSLMKIVVPAVIGLYFEPKTQKNKQMKSSKQNFLLYFISNLSPSEIKCAVDQFLDRIGFNFVYGESERLYSKMEGVELKTWKTLFQFLELAIKNFGLQIAYMSPKMLEMLSNAFELLTFGLKCLTEKSKNNDDDAQSAKNEKYNHILLKLKECRRQALDLIAKIFTTYLELNFDSCVKKIMPLLGKRIQTLDLAQSTALNAPLKLLSIFSEFEKFKVYFIQFDFLVPSLCGLLKKAHISEQTANAIIHIIHNLFEYSPGNDKSLATQTEAIIRQKAIHLHLTDLFAEGPVCTPKLKDPHIKEEIQKSFISTLGKYIVQRYLSEIIESLTVYIKNTSRHTVKYKTLANSQVLHILTVIFENVGFTDETQFDSILDICFYYLSAKNLRKLNFRENILLSDEERDQITGVQISVKIENYIRILRIVQDIFKVASSASDHFLNKILPLFIVVERPEIFIELVKLAQSLSINPKANYLISSLRFISNCLKSSRKIDNDLDYDSIYNEMASVQNSISSFDIINQKVILVILFRLVGSHDLGARIKSLEILEAYFHNSFELAANRRQELADQLWENVIYLVNYVPVMFSRSYSKEESLRNYLSLFVYYLKQVESFMNNSQIHVITSGRLPYADIVNISHIKSLFEILHPKTKMKTAALFNIRDFLIENKNFNYSYLSMSTTIIPLIENIVVTEYARSYSKSFSDFRKQESKRAEFYSFSTISAEVVSILMTSFSASKVVAYLSKKINLLHKRPQYKVVLFHIIERILDMFKFFEGSNNIIETINSSLSTQAEKILSQKIHVEQFCNYQPLPALQQTTYNHKTKNSKFTIDVKESNKALIKESLEQNNGPVFFQQDGPHDSLPVWHNENNVLRKLQGPMLNTLKMILSDSKKEQDVTFVNQVALCIIKIMQNLPLNDFIEEYIKIIIELVHLLKNKNVQDRMKTLKTLLSIAKKTGPYLLDFIIIKLKDVLVNPADKHTRNYAVWYLMHHLTATSIKDFPKSSATRKENHVVGTYGVDKILKNEDLASENENRIQTKEGKKLTDGNNVLFIFGIGCFDHLCIEINKLVVQETFSDMFTEKDNEERKNKSKEMKKHKSRAILSLISLQTDIRSGAVK